MSKVKDDKKEYILEYDMIFMNVLVFILLFIMLGISYLLVKINIFEFNGEMLLEFFDNYSVLFLITMLLWLVLHEIIHGVAYRIGGASKEDIVFGAAIEHGVFYCKAKKYINKKCIMMSLLAPLILIGIVTYIIGIMMSNIFLIGLSIINITGAAGDIMMFLFFLRQDDDILFRELGFSSPAVILTSRDITKEKYLGVKNIRLVTDQSEVTEGEEKKITISKASWIYLAIMAVLVIVMTLLSFLEK